VRSIANADLAAGCDPVVIIAPMDEANGPVAIPETELAALRPARVRVIYADPASLAAFGSNPLDPATRASSARAGRQQGRRIAADLVAFLSDPAAGAETP
jgi:NTE family protein